jgi:hypothetical protein
MNVSHYQKTCCKPTESLAKRRENCQQQVTAHQGLLQCFIHIPLKRLTPAWCGITQGRSQPPRPNVDASCLYYGFDSEPLTVKSENGINFY